VAAVAALAERSQQVAQRAVAEEVQRLVGDLEGDLWLILPAAALTTSPPLGLEIGRCRNVALFAHPLDDLLNQLLELGPHLLLIAVRRVAQQPFDRFFGQDAAIEERVENRVVQRLHRPLLVVHAAVGVAKPAGQKKIRQLGHQIFEIQFVEQVAGEFRVSVFHPDPWPLFPGP